MKPSILESGKILISIVILNLVLLFPEVTVSQTSYEIVIGNSNDSEFFICGKKDHEGNIILTGTSQEYNTIWQQYHKGSLLVKVDTLGEHITSTIHLQDTNCGLFNVMITSDSNYLFTGYVEGYNADSNQLWLYKTDKLLNKLWEKRFRIPLNEGYTHCEFASYGIKATNGNLILSAYASYLHYSHDDLVLIEIDEQGNLINSRQFHYQFSQSHVDLQAIPNSSEILMITEHISIIGYPVRIFRLDSTLQTISIKPIESSEYKYGMIGTVPHWLNDTSFIYCGDIGPGGNPVSDEEIGVCILDSTFTVHKEILIGKPDTIDYPGYTNCIDYYNDTTIYIAGFINHLSFWPDDPNIIEVYRIDTGLNILGKAELGGDAYNRIYGVIATNDGGCLLYGSRYGANNYFEEDAYILKINPNDLTVSTNDLEINQNIGFHFFPNPTDNELNIHLDEYLVKEKVIVGIYNSSGKLIKELEFKNKEFVIDCSFLHPGTYYLTLSDNNQLIMSEVFIKIN